MRRRLPWTLAVLALVAILAVGLSRAQKPSAPRAPRITRAQIERRLAGAPSALASLHGQSSRVLGGGRRAFRARLRALRGHPVVVNVWAAWCGPCRVELPVLAQASLAHGRRVAFVGVDLRDSRDAASRLLARVPVAYPSYEDPDGRLFESYRLHGVPSTVYYDAHGQQTYVHQGPYTDRAQIDEDIQRYAAS